LNTIAEALNQEVDLARALNTALGHVAALFGLQTGWVFLLDEMTVPIWPLPRACRPHWLTIRAGWAGHVPVWMLIATMNWTIRAISHAAASKIWWSARWACASMPASRWRHT